MVEEATRTAQPASRSNDETGKQETTSAKFGLFASPVLLSIVGIVGTGVGALSQGYWNTVLEQRKFEYTLIEKALDTPDRAEAQKGLRFLAETGLVQSLNPAKISSIQPSDIPLFLGAAVRDKLISIKDAKTVLAHAKQYDGPIDDNSDDAFKKAVANFQMANNLPPDGMIGPATYGKLVESWPDHFKSGAK